MAREAAVASWLFAQSSLAGQTWNSESATITGLPATVQVGSTATVSLSSPMSLTGARITWEGTAMEPRHGGTSFTFSPDKPGSSHIAADILFPDGRRLSALEAFTATEPVANEIEAYQTIPIAENWDAIAWYALDGNYSDNRMQQVDVTPDSGNAQFDGTTFQWPSRANGEALNIHGPNDGATAPILDALLDNNVASAFSVEAMLYVRSFPINGSVDFLRLHKTSDNQPSLRFGSSSAGLEMYAGYNQALNDATLRPLLTLNTWHHLKLRLDASGYTFTLDGNVIHTSSSGDFNVWGNYSGGRLTFGHFDG